MFTTTRRRLMSRLEVITPQSVHDHIIWSADVPDWLVLRGRLADARKLRYVKIDRAFVERERVADFAVLTDEFGVQIFYDAKYVEIPVKLEELARIGVAKRPWMVNCMAGGLSNGASEAEKRDHLDGLKRFADVCHEASVRACAVTVLTSKTPTIVEAEFNGRNSMEQVLYYVERLLEFGFTDVVCSPDEVPAIRAESRFDALDLDTPGIRRKGTDARDQARVNTPEAALAAGSTRLVIGSNLTDGNLAENYEALVAEILAA